MKTVCVLGSTGSIGTNTLDVLRHLRHDFRVVGLAAGKNADVLARQIAEFEVPFACLHDTAQVAELRQRVGQATTLTVFAGPRGLIELVEAANADIYCGAITGAAGMAANLRAVEMGKRLALSNKESLVMAGEVFTRTAKVSGAEIIPVDSEHSALFQDLQCGRRDEVVKLILTASGGPFRTRDRQSFDRITVAEALRHPTWAMGKKVTIDSATMMNKTLEVLEARWLFDMTGDQIEVVVHPQSLVHSLVEFVDGSIMAQLSVPDMRLPIQYALTFPRRKRGPMVPFRVKDFATLTFEPADVDAFPALRLGYEAGRQGGTMGAVLNAANEVAVERFLASEHDAPTAIRFVDIAALVGSIMARHAVVANPTLDDIWQADRWARQMATAWTR